MPLLHVDLIEGRAAGEIRTLLDAIHDAVVEAFGVPPRDRYQIVRTHPSHEIVVWHTGLGIETYQSAVAAEDFEAAAILTGESIGLIHAVRPAADIVAEMAAEADRILNRTNSV
jgi:hypothetical protein